MPCWWQHAVLVQAQVAVVLDRAQTYLEQFQYQYDAAQVSC